MSANQPDNEQQLLTDIQRGDQRAFESLFNEWYARLVFFAESFMVDRGEAEEIVSECFVRFWTARDQFDAVNKIKSFLYTSTRNASLNVLRRNKLHPTTEFPTVETAATDSFAEAEAAHAEIIATLFAEIERLPDRCREVVLLTYREGLSSADIAARLGITVSTVTSQRARAIQLLKIALAEKYPSLAGLSIASLLHQIFFRC